MFSFSDNEYLTPEDVENDGMFTSISIDSIPEGSIKMDLRFKNTHELYLYAPCNALALKRVKEDPPFTNKSIIAVYSICNNKALK